MTNHADETKREYNCFHEYISTVLDRKGLNQTVMGKTLGVARQFSWDHTYRPTAVFGKRKDLVQRVAEFLSEPISKLVFLAGFNPWAERFNLQQQAAVWEFVERLTTAKEKGMPKPPASAYTHLCNEIFGGAEVVNKISSREMAEYLRPDDE